MSIPQMELKRGGTAIAINTPQFGYRTELRLAMLRGERLGGGLYPWFDREIENDIRFFHGTWDLPADQQKDLQDFFKDPTKGRGNTVQMKVPPGVFPFGPDLGGGWRRFMVRLTSAEFGPAQNAPWLHFKTDASFVLVSAPPYNIPDIDNGTYCLQIGTVGKLRQPPNRYSSATQYAVATDASGTGPHSIDRTAGADYWETEFATSEGETRSAHILHYLQNEARANDFTITVQKNGFLFGRDNSGAPGTKNPGSGIYTVNLMDNIIECTHNRPGDFAVAVKACFKSYAAL